MKQTVREKDIPDRLLLRRLLEGQGIKVEDRTDRRVAGCEGLRAWLKRIFGRET